MTRTMSTFAPTGVLARGSAVARPHAGVAVRLSAVAARVAVSGTGVPTARLRHVTTGVTWPPHGEFIAQRSTTNDGTTLGFHPSRRPPS
jgi:hypothetical protein